MFADPCMRAQVAAALRADGIPAVALHGGLGQNERESALRDFSTHVVKVGRVGVGGRVGGV